MPTPTVAEIWVRFAAACLSRNGWTTIDAAETADQMLVKFKQRFGPPTEWLTEESYKDASWKEKSIEAIK